MGNNSQGEKCPIGNAVSTPLTTLTSASELRKEYDMIVHTVPPFYKYSHLDKPNVSPEHLLAQCYRNALRVSFEEGKFQDKREHESRRIACPLLGAGGRGFPIETAIEVAAAECVRWRDDEWDDDDDDDDDDD